MFRAKARKKVRVVRCPNELLSYTNCAIIREDEFNQSQNKHVEITSSLEKSFIFTLLPSKENEMAPSTMGFNLPMRKWAELSIDEEIMVVPYIFDSFSQKIARIMLEVDFLRITNTSQEAYDADEMAKEFLSKYPSQAFTSGQFLAFDFKDKSILKLTVKKIEVFLVDQSKEAEATNSKAQLKFANIGLLLHDSLVSFDKAANSTVNLIGKSRRLVRQPIINPEWDFQKLGIGGLDKEFNDIFRRAFASRVFPPEMVENLGLKHVRGILLYGPPGTGKTLMARQIGQMLNAREPKIVNGPQILDKFVGESEANIRRLFVDAEEEEKRLGPDSGLHIIIFDEIDAICKTRGSVAGNAPVHDTVVNQLLAKIDGIESLNNILIIGMTNRKDMIDEALLRPGRLEVQMEIGLPSEYGRSQILDIHTLQMRNFQKMHADVNLQELAALTKNFSGAEIEGLVRAAQSTAMNRLIKASNKVEIDPEASEKLIISRADFLHAFENDIKPAFGTSGEDIGRLISQGIINWGPPVDSILQDGELFVQQTSRTENKGLVTVLLEGPSNSGKTALAARIALKSEFPFIKLCTPEDMVGFTETAKCSSIKKVFDDAYKSVLSCILVDNIERLLDYGSIGPKYSNLVLQALLVLLKREPPPGRKLLVLCTTSCRRVMEQMEIVQAFTAVLHVPNISQPEYLSTVLEETSCFNEQDCVRINAKIKKQKVFVPIKKLLAFIDMARQTERELRVVKFLDKLEEEGAIVLQ